jgi:hypothetical protein
MKNIFFKLKETFIESLKTSSNRSNEANNYYNLLSNNDPKLTIDEYLEFIQMKLQKTGHEKTTPFLLKTRISG